MVTTDVEKRFKKMKEMVNGVLVSRNINGMFRDARTLVMVQ